MIRPNLGQGHFAQSSLASESCFLSAHFGFRRERARQMMPQTAPGRNDEYHALPGGRDKGTRSPDRPHGVSKASESQLTESNLTSANRQELPRDHSNRQDLSRDLPIVSFDCGLGLWLRLWPMTAIPPGAEVVANAPGNMTRTRPLQDRRSNPGARAGNLRPSGMAANLEPL